MTLQNNENNTILKNEIRIIILFLAVFRIRIRIRIHMFLGLPDPAPPVRCMDPDPALDPSIIMQK
jgi:hypothetical protein